MKCMRLFFKPFVGLFALVLFANAAAPVRPDAKEDLEKAAAKTEEMIRGSDVIRNGNAAIEFLTIAREGMRGNEDSSRYARDAISLLEDAIKDYEGGTGQKGLEYAQRARELIGKAITSYKPS